MGARFVRAYFLFGGGFDTPSVFVLVGSHERKRARRPILRVGRAGRALPEAFSPAVRRGAVLLGGRRGGCLHGPVQRLLCPFRCARQERERNPDLDRHEQCDGSAEEGETRAGNADRTGTLAERWQRCEHCCGHPRRCEPGGGLQPVDARTRRRPKFKGGRPDGEPAPAIGVLEQHEPHDQGPAHGFAPLGEPQLREAKRCRQAGVGAPEAAVERPRQQVPAVRQRAQARTRHLPQPARP